MDPRKSQERRTSVSHGDPSEAPRSYSSVLSGRIMLPSGAGLVGLTLNVLVDVWSSPICTWGIGLRYGKVTTIIIRESPNHFEQIKHDSNNVQSQPARDGARLGQGIPLQ